MVEYHREQLSSLPDEDFEVIQASLSPYDMSILPQENTPTAYGGNLSTQTGTACHNELLTAQLAAAIERCADMRMSLSNNCILINRLTHQHQRLASQLDQCNQAKAELALLRNRQEEWQQTMEDYMKLKNQYNLLANTKERLESEKADLLNRLSSHQETVSQQDGVNIGLASENQTLKDQNTLLANANERLESEKASLLGKLQSQQLGLLQHNGALLTSTDEASTDQSISELEKIKLNAYEVENEVQKLKDIIAAKDMLEKRLLESNNKYMLLEEEVQQMKQQVSILEAKLLEETLKYSSAEQRHCNELADLRQNSNVRELEDLRRDLYTCLKREQELSDHYKDSDLTINQIINDAEKSKRELQDELDAVKRERQSLFDSLDGTSKRLQDVTHREMDRCEEVKNLTARLSLAENAHRQELHDTIQLHLDETISRSQASQRLEIRLREVERDLEASAAEVEQLKARIDELTRENAESARTVNEVLIQADSEKKGVQTELSREKSVRADLEEQLQRKISAHTEAMQSVESLRRHSVEVQHARASLERQLRESNAKCEESVNFANQMHDRLQAEMAKSRELEAELTSLRCEHNSIRYNYTSMETKVNECLSVEHTLESRAQSAEDRVTSLEVALDNYRRDFDNEQRERLALLAEKNSLADQLQRVRSCLQPPNQRDS